MRKPSLCMLGSLCFCWRLLTFFIFFLQKIFEEDPDQDPRCVSHNLGPNHIDRWLGMVYLPHPRWNFVDLIFLKAQCVARILQHVSHLAMVKLTCNSPLHTLPTKFVIFYINYKTSEHCKR